MKMLDKRYLEGDIIITDPMYIVNHAKLEDESTKPQKEQFYPVGWIPPTEEDYFNNTEKALFAKRYEQSYKEAIDSWYRALPSDWDVCNYGDNMNHLGFRDYMVQDTIYGDWSCTAFDLNSNILGRFTSDSGLVGVFLLSEILKYNPRWDIYLSKPYCATLITNFAGDVMIINKGGIFPGDCDVRIVGNGNICFYTKQTGF